MKAGTQSVMTRLASGFFCGLSYGLVRCQPTRNNAEYKHSQNPCGLTVLKKGERHHCLYLQRHDTLKQQNEGSVTVVEGHTIVMI